VWGTFFHFHSELFEFILRFVIGVAQKRSGQVFFQFFPSYPMLLLRYHFRYCWSRSMVCFQSHKTCSLSLFLLLNSWKGGNGRYAHLLDDITVLSFLFLIYSVVWNCFLCKFCIRSIFAFLFLFHLCISLLFSPVIAFYLRHQGGALLILISLSHRL